MLLVKTTVKPSSIAGMGLFADENIKRGSKIWRFNLNTCALYTRVQLETLMGSIQHEEIMQYYLTYGFYIAHFESLTICLDNARFFNHSTEPNSGQVGHSEEAWEYSVALRDISKGEELLENYSTYDSTLWLSEMHKNFMIFDAQ